MMKALTIQEAGETAPSGPVAELPARGRPSWPALVSRRAALYLLTLFGVVTLVFALPRAMPGDPIDALQDPSSSFFLPDPESRRQLAAQYGLDRPLLAQYGSYLAGLVRGDLGWSIEAKTPVASLVGRHLPWSLLLWGSALVVSAATSFFTGITAAWNRNRARDRLLVVAMAGSRAIPPYAVAALLLVLFAVLLPLFPLSGASTAFADHASAWSRAADVARHAVLPVSALVLVLVGTKFLLVRNTVISALGEDYMMLARAKGLPTRLLKYRHAGRNALLPFVTLIGVEAGFAVGPLIFVEAVFAYPGLGSLILRAVAARDYPVLEAAFLVFAVIVLTANFLVDLAYSRLDPRVAR